MSDALGRGWLWLLSTLSIGLLLSLSAGMLWSQREALLQRAEGQAQREVRRLAAELAQALRLAQASVQVHRQMTAPHGDPLLGDHAPLVATLNLPFSLRQLETGAEDMPVALWRAELARESDGQWVVPLRWRPSAPAPVYEVALSRDALLSRFASEGLPAGGSMTLFRLNDDGSTTILVRYPLVPREQGLTIRSHVSEALLRAPSGVFQAEARIDGIRRVVGYHRLDDGADRLVLVYALGVDDVLSSWTADLPWAVVMTVLLAAAMAYGGWRLDRSLRALRRSEQHFHSLTDHIPDVIVRYDQQGRVLYVNPSIVRANGVEPDNMVGRTFAEFGTPPELAERWMASLRRVFDSGQPEILYFTYPGPDGERHWEAQVGREPSLPGEPPTVLVINRDITGRVEAEQRQAIAQRLFETVFRSAPEAMSLSDWATGRLILVNDAYCRLFGRPREQFIGRTAIELGLWGQPASREQLLAALDRGESVRDVSGRSVRADGQQIQVRYSAEKVVVDEQTQLLLMFRDVTQLERDQRALARNEQRFRLAAAHGQVWEWDFGRGFVQPSAEFFVSLGHPAPSLEQMGPQFLDLLHPEDRPRLQQMLRAFLKDEGDYRLEFRARDALGCYRWFDTRGSGLRDANGRVTYMAGTTFDVTDRKALEETQRQTLKHLDTVVNAIPALIWTTDDQRHPDWVNQAWLDFTGRSLREACDFAWIKALHPDDQTRCETLFNAAFERREPYSMEYRLRRQDGQYRWLLEQGRPRYDADNAFIGFVGSCLDVTELRAAEATARERGAMLEQVFDVVQDMLFVVDDAERFVFYKAVASAGLYRPPEAFLGKTVADVMPPDLVPMFRTAMHRARDRGAQELDYSLDMTDGARHFNARLAWLPGGQQCMFLVRDTTEQQRAGQARERLADFVFLLFRLASRFINLPLQQMDRAIDSALGDVGGFVGADRAYLFTYDLQAESAHNTHEWCAPGVSPQKDRLQNVPIRTWPDWDQAHLRGERIHVPDVEALPPGPLRSLLGSLGIRSVLSLPLMNGRDCLGFVGLDAVHAPRVYGSEEITLLELFSQMIVNLQLRRAAAEQVREMTELLEHKVVERTRQLNDSVQRLQAVNRELESFNYSASHDLRTPLRGIEGFSTLLLEEHAQQLDDQGREYLRRIQRATRHMAQLVSDLLAYSRLPQATEHIESVNLARAVGDVLLPFRDELAARGGDLQVDVPEGLTVRADPQGLAIVLRNLVDNALKFTPAEQAPLVHIGARPEAGRVRLQVRDHGMGFDMRYRDRIFGMFQRLHRHDQIPGTGIGLALVQRAVERMGGGIDAHGEPGKGATFTLDLPAA